MGVVIETQRLLLRQGQGYATEAARAVGSWARAERGVEALVSVIAPDNVASRRVAERLGARPEETITLADSGEAVVWAYPADLR